MLLVVTYVTRVGGVHTCMSPMVFAAPWGHGNFLIFPPKLYISMNSFAMLLMKNYDKKIEFYNNL